MKNSINWNHQFTDENGKPVSHGGKPGTLRTVAITALLYSKFTEDTAETKALRYQAAVTIQKHKDASITEVQKKILKKCIADAMIPLVVGQAFAVIDGQEPEMFELPAKEQPADTLAAVQ